MTQKELDAGKISFTVRYPQYDDNGNLEEKGKRKTVLFRVERNLTEESERALLERLRALREA